MLVSGLIEGTLETANQSGAQALDDVRQFPRRLAAFTAAAGAASRELKTFLHARVYSSSALDEDRSRSTVMMGELFDFYLEYSDRLPQPYREMLDTEPVHRVVCDYIAGMTDSFFRRTHEHMLAATRPRR
jgi:dGTPase